MCDKVPEADEERELDAKRRRLSKFLALALRETYMRNIVHQPRVNMILGWWLSSGPGLLP
jgi:hypothetical protein